MLEISNVTTAELPEIQRIAYQTWPMTFGDILSPQQIDYMLDWMYSIPSLTAQIEEKGHVFLLIKENEACLGYVSYELNYKNEPNTKIHKIYLLPASQGKGAGAALIRKVAEIATDNHNSALLLNVNRYNKAVGFYEKMGFSIVGSEDIDIGDGFLMQDYIMAKPL